MSQKIIGSFSNIGQAEDARSYLLSNGFGTENIDIFTNAGTDSVNNGITGQKGMIDNINNINTNLSAGQKGFIVSVLTQNSDEALEASEVLINYGALDVNDPIGSTGNVPDGFATEAANPDSDRNESPAGGQ